MLRYAYIACLVKNITGMKLPRTQSKSLPTAAYYLDQLIIIIITTWRYNPT
jgi:hypothetical protein